MVTRWSLLVGLCVVGGPAAAFSPTLSHGIRSGFGTESGTGTGGRSPCRLTHSSSIIISFVQAAPRPDAPLPAATSGNSKDSNEDPPARVQWYVYVDQSKASIDKGAAATLDAFIGLAPPGIVQVHAAIFQSIPAKVKGPVVRCVEILSRNDGGDNGVNDNDTPDDCRSFEVANVDSVDKVARILRKHMKVSLVGGNSTTESLKWKYQGTSHLEKGQIDLAIDCYDRALETSNDGILFLLRAAAYLARSAGHRDQLRENVQALTDAVDLDALQTALVTAGTHDITLANPIFQRILQTTAQQEGQ
jgi:tetratricopeptide (TPR) repeat protein